MADFYFFLSECCDHPQERISLLWLWFQLFSRVINLKLQEVFTDDSEDKQESGAAHES